MDWVYDYATDSKGNIVAMNYHQPLSKVPDHFCLQAVDKELAAEGLELDVSETFPTLAQALHHAWTRREKFIKGLD